MNLIIKKGIAEKDIKLWDPEKVMAAMDHGAPPTSEVAADRQKKQREIAQKFGVKYYYDVYEGILHQVIHEKGHLVPGQLAVGSDSHTTTYGALNIAATGIGASEMAYVLMTGELWLRVPETIKIEITGKLPDYIFSKDIILEIGGKYGTEVAQYKSIEWVGSAIDQTSLDGRFTMGNMSVELGAKFGIFKADKKTIDYVKAHSNKPFTPVESDPDAVYSQIITVDGSKSRA